MGRINYSDRKRLAEKVYKTGYRPIDHVTSYGEREDLLKDYYNNQYNEEFGDKLQLTDEDYFELERQIEDYEREQNIKRSFSRGTSESSDGDIGTGIAAVIMTAIILFFISGARVFFLPSLLVSRLGLELFGYSENETFHWILAIVIAMLLSIVLRFVSKRMPHKISKMTKDQALAWTASLFAIVVGWYLSGEGDWVDFLISDVPIILMWLGAFYKKTWFKFALLLDIVLSFVYIILNWDYYRDAHSSIIYICCYIITEMILMLIIANVIPRNGDWIFILALQVLTFWSINSRIDVYFLEHWFYELVDMALNLCQFLAFYFAYRAARCSEVPKKEE